ncbi:MAG: ABC transporter ATP-binding protein [Anaerolineae bacterium]|jgi:ABC-type Fe3+/spermidine/putrescine transport system ATPase subunit
MPFLEIRNLGKSYPDGWTLSEVTLAVEEGEIISFLGPSGCGKTTLLRLIAGLETPEAGEVLVKGEEVTHMPPHLRGFGLMFQEYALFPHRDVFGNVAFGLHIASANRDTTQARVTEVLELVGLAGFEQRDVNQLSGGERQRVALARSLAPQPRLLMLDEPLGALDRTLRERLLEELPTILKRVGVTTITVTHDQEEAFAIADRVAVMHAGRVVQQGTPEEVYREPASRWVAQFLGLTNLLSARVVAEGTVETPLGQLQVGRMGGVSPGSEGTLLVRPEAARLGDAETNRVSGVVTGHTFRGSRYRVDLKLEGEFDMTFDWPASQQPPETGTRVVVSLDLKGLALLTA